MDPNGLDPANFAIALSSIGNFNSAIALSISGLPAGLTGVFSPDVVTPSGTSILTLTAVDDSLSGLFNFDIVAEGGGNIGEPVQSVQLFTTVQGRLEHPMRTDDKGVPDDCSDVQTRSEDEIDNETQDALEI